MSEKETRTQIPEGVTKVRNAATREIKAMADENTTAKGNVVAAGHLVFEEGEKYKDAIIIQFKSGSDMRKALKDLKAEYTLFGCDDD